MQVRVLSDDGNVLFVANVGSNTQCDGNTCDPWEVKRALELAVSNSDLPMSDEDYETFKERRQYSRMHRAA